MTSKPAVGNSRGRRRVARLCVAIADRGFSAGVRIVVETVAQATTNDRDVLQA